MPSQLQFLHRVGFALTLRLSLILALMFWQVSSLPPHVALPVV